MGGRPHDIVVYAHAQFGLFAVEKEPLSLRAMLHAVEAEFAGVQELFVYGQSTPLVHVVAELAAENDQRIVAQPAELRHFAKEMQQCDEAELFKAINEDVPGQRFCSANLIQKRRGRSRVIFSVE